MELKHDWRAFNAVLYPQEAWAGAESATQKLVLLEDQERIVDGIVSTGARFTDQGMESPARSLDLLEGLASKYGVDQTMVLSHRALQDAVLEAASQGTNYYQQLETIRNRWLAAQPTTRRGKKAPLLLVSRAHFVLQTLTGRAARFLPRNYNFLVFVDTSQGSEFSSKALLIHMKQGKVEQFFEPDFASLHENRLQEWEKQKDAVVEYLENRYLLPCFALFIKKAAWERCVCVAAQGKNPWKTFMKHYDGGQATVYPKTFSIQSFLAAQKILMYFGRE